MKGSALLLAIATTVLVGCTDQNPRSDLTAPAKAPEAVQPAVNSASTVCRAYAAHLVKLEAALKAAPNAGLQAEVEEFRGIVDESCN